MNGAQDLGGMQGFGPVVRDHDDAHFHESWEPRAFALTLAMLNAELEVSAACFAKMAVITLVPDTVKVELQKAAPST